MTPSTVTITGTEVSGETVLATTKGMRGLRKRLRNLLAEHGLDAPQPNLWYSQDELLDVFDALADDALPFIFSDMGAQVAHDAEFPEEIDSVQQALAHVDAFHRSHHRGSRIGSYAFEKTGERSGTIVCKTPYPCDFDRSFLQAIAQRFRPDRSCDVIVRHAESASCRERGDESYDYVVRW